MKTTFSEYICVSGIGNEDRPCVTIRIDYIYGRAISYRAVPARSDKFCQSNLQSKLSGLLSSGKDCRYDRNFRSRRMQFVIRYRLNATRLCVFSLFLTSSSALLARPNNALISAITLGRLHNFWSMKSVAQARPRQSSPDSYVIYFEM